MWAVSDLNLDYFGQCGEPDTPFTGLSTVYELIYPVPFVI